MAYQVITEEEPLNIENIVIVVFGEPGIGKTSLSFTSENPIVEDFDKGVQRAVGRKAFVSLQSWEDAVEFHNSGYIQENNVKTVIFDTAGTMLDNYITNQVIKDDPKNAKKDGSLALGGYGAIKNVFNAFVNNMQMLGVDLIFICHDDDERNKEEIKKKPKVTGGSYDILKQRADLIGYMETDRDKRVIDFNPCDRHVGKNSAQIEKQIIPEYTSPEYKDFMAKLIKKAKDKMNEMSEAQEKAIKLMDEFMGKIEVAESIEELSPVYDSIEEMPQVYKVQLTKAFNDKYLIFFKDLLSKVEYTTELDEVVAQAKDAPAGTKGELRKVLGSKAKDLGFTFDKELEIYVGPDGKPTARPDNETETENKDENKAVEASDNANQAESQESENTATADAKADEKKETATQTKMM